MDNHSTKPHSDGEGDASKRKRRSRSVSTTSSKPILVAQSSRKDIYASPTPASSPAAPSTMLGLSASRRNSVDKSTVDLESSSEADSIEFGSGTEEATRLLSMSVRHSQLSSSGGGILGKMKRRLSTSSKRKAEESESMLTKAAISALSQQIDDETYRIPSSIPELTIDSDDKLFSLKNMYFNLRRDLHSQLLLLQTLETSQVEAQRKFMLTQFSELRSKHTRTEVLISNVSRGGVYAVNESSKKSKEIVKPRSEEDYSDKPCRGGCFGCF